MGHVNWIGAIAVFGPIAGQIALGFVIAARSGSDEPGPATDSARRPGSLATLSRAAFWTIACVAVLTTVQYALGIVPPTRW